MQQKPGTRTLVLASALLLGFILLAAALDGFELASGLRIEPTFADTIDRAMEIQDRRGRNWYDGRMVGWLVSVVVGLAIVLFFVGLFRREHRLSTILLVVLGAGAVFLITRIPPPQEEVEVPAEEGGFTPGAGEEGITTTDPLAEEDAVDVEPAEVERPAFWSWLLAAVALVGLFFVIRPRLPSFRRTDDDGSGETPGDAAREALRTASGGEDVLETVVRCYRDMLEIYQRTQYGGRKRSLTPREFTEKLQQAGVPAEHADGLTTLFERTRYGSVRLEPEEERRTLEHLRVIATALEQRGRGRAQ